MFLKISFLFAAALFTQIPGLTGCQKEPRYHVPDQSPVPVELKGEGTPGDVSPIRKRYLNSDHFGYIVYDLEKKEVLESLHPDQPFIPASTAKLFTSIAALDVLGPKHRSATILARDGNIRDGKLVGHLYLKGTGDPSLRVGDLARMVDDLKRAGVREVLGNFHYDDSTLPRVKRISSVMDSDESYNAGISALSFEFNAISIRWYPPAHPGEKGDFYLYPDLPMNDIILVDKSWEDERRLWVQQNGEKERWVVPRDVKRVGGKRLPVRNPSLFAAQVFAKLASLEGIQMGEPQAGVTPKNAKVLSKHRGGSLLSEVESLLMYSNNIMAELIMLKTARRLGKKPESLEEGAQALEEYFKKRFVHVNWEGFRLVNGSGLTSKTEITPRQLASLLVYADTRYYNEIPFRSLLSTSGITWSLRNRLNRPDSVLRVRAKTGTINYSVALGGYAYTQKGKRLAFAFFVTDPRERKKYENDPKRRTREVQQDVGGWIWRHRLAMDAIIEGWVRRY